MKKFLVLMFAFLLCMPLAACGSDKAADKAEYYKLSAANFGDEPMTGEMLALAGIDSWYIVLNANGSGVFYNDKKSEITWTGNKLKAGDESLDFVREGNKLIIQLGDEGSIEFTLSSDAPPAN